MSLLSVGLLFLLETYSTVDLGSDFDFQSHLVLGKVEDHCVTAFDMFSLISNLALSASIGPVPILGIRSIPFLITGGFVMT